MLLALLQQRTARLTATQPYGLAIHSTDMSRTNQKLLLMREQLQQQERREALQQRVQSGKPAHAHGLMHQSVAHSAPVMSPVAAQHQQILKLQNDIRLENPTSFHLMQSQHQSQMMSQSQPQQHHGAGQILQQPQSPLGPGLGNGPTSPFPLSPESPLSAHPSSVSEFEDGMWADVIRTLDLTDSGLNVSDEQPIAATLPADVGFLYSPSHVQYKESPPSSVPNDSKLSSSCPPLNEGEERHVWTKERQKKDNHNKIERRRRYNINDRIQELGTLLPRGDARYSHLVRDMKYNKGTILKASVDFVKTLKREVENSAKLADENRRLVSRIQELEQERRHPPISVKQDPDDDVRIESSSCKQHEPLPMITEVKSESLCEEVQSSFLPVNQHHDHLLTHKIADSGCWPNLENPDWSMM